MTSVALAIGSVLLAWWAICWYLDRSMAKLGREQQLADADEAERIERLTPIVEIRPNGTGGAVR